MTDLASGMWAPDVCHSWADTIKKGVYHVFDLFPIWQLAVEHPEFPGMGEPQDGKDLYDHMEENLSPNGTTPLLGEMWNSDVLCHWTLGTYLS